MTQSPQIVWPVPGNTITTSAGLNYLIGQPLDQGGFSLVFEGLDMFSNPIALKIYKPIGRPFEEVKKQWEHEISIFLKLRHPNVVTIYDAFICGNLFYIVLERALTNIYSFISHLGPLNEPQTREIARQLLFALHFIHTHGVLHRDITINNVLVFEGPQSKGYLFKLGDFGISKDFIVPWADKTTHTRVAHPTFIPPELLDPNNPLSNERSDLYHLGLILLFCLEGKLPFDDKMPKDEIDKLIIDGAPRKQAETIQTPFGSFLSILLHPHNEQRFPNALEAWKSLQSLK